MYNILNNLICYSLIILGAILLLVSVLYLKSVVPRASDVKINNEQEFLKSKRKLYSTIGICYIILGVIILLKVLKIGFAAPFIALLPLTQMIFDNRINKKYLDKIDSN